jgi:hypothetical protein
LLRHFAHRNRYPGVDLFGIEARRYGRIREVHRFRLLADEQYACHVIFLHLGSFSEFAYQPASSSDTQLFLALSDRHGQTSYRVGATEARL